MDSSWVVALDGLASAGVIDYDAPAFLLGVTPRYVGNPKLADIPGADLLILSEKNAKVDDNGASKMIDNQKTLISNPKWKKRTFWSVIAGLTVIGCLALTGKLSGINRVINSAFKKSGTFLAGIMSKFKKP